MSTRIESVASAGPHHRVLARGSRGLAEAAARACLDRAHRRACELDLLIHVGVYKDRNMAEPALASLVQEDLGANPGHPPVHGRHGTFSFDVLDGACGSITASHLADAFVRDGRARLGLIVAGDADPSPATSRGFPFPAAGGAWLLAHADGADGFQRFAFRTFAEHAGLFGARLRWDPEQRGAFGRRGRNVVEVHEDPRFAAVAAECAASVARALLEGAELRGADVGLLVTSQVPLHLGDVLAAALGIDPARVARADESVAGAHTAGPMAALDAAVATGRFDGVRDALFVTVGAGVKVAAALYRGCPGRHIHGTADERR